MKSEKATHPKRSCSVANGHRGAVWPHVAQKPFNSNVVGPRLQESSLVVKAIPPPSSLPTLSSCPTEPGFQMIKVDTFTDPELSHVKQCSGLFHLIFIAIQGRYCFQSTKEEDAV